MGCFHSVQNGDDFLNYNEQKLFNIMDEILNLYIDDKKINEDIDMNQNIFKDVLNFMLFISKLVSEEHKDYYKSHTLDCYGYCYSYYLYYIVKIFKNNRVRYVPLKIACHFVDEHFSNEFTKKEKLTAYFQNVCLQNLNNVTNKQFEIFNSIISLTELNVNDCYNKTEVFVDNYNYRNDIDLNYSEKNDDIFPCFTDKIYLMSIPENVIIIIQNVMQYKFLFCCNSIKINNNNDFNFFQEIDKCSDIIHANKEIIDEKQKQLQINLELPITHELIKINDDLNVSINNLKTLNSSMNRKIQDLKQRLHINWLYSKFFNHCINF